MSFSISSRNHTAILVSNYGGLAVGNRSHKKTISKSSGDDNQRTTSVDENYSTGTTKACFVGEYRTKLNIRVVCKLYINTASNTETSALMNQGVQLEMFPVVFSQITIIKVYSGA